MKRRAFCLLIALILILSATAHADIFSGFQRRNMYGEMLPYENRVYGYSLQVYESFAMLDDETCEAMLAEANGNSDAGRTDESYDLRVWYSPDSRYVFEVTVKQPTYASFETEVQNAPNYLTFTNADPSRTRMLHDGILRSTPAGDMLEIAVISEDQVEGTSYQTLFMYYDFYQDGLEYCFILYDYGVDYDSAQALLDELCQTITVAMRFPA